MCRRQPDLRRAEVAVLERLWTAIFGRMYREFAVTGALARFIECVWELAPEPSEMSASIRRIFPDGASDIVIAPGEGEAPRDSWPLAIGCARRLQNRGLSVLRR